MNNDAGSGCSYPNGQDHCKGATGRGIWKTPCQTYRTQGPGFQGNHPDDAMIIKVDRFLSPDKIFNGNKGECKRCDYVIISPEKRCILYIEIKRTKDKGGWKHIVEQLKGGQCFVSYCRTVGKHFWDKKDFLSGYKNRFICIGHTNIAKRKTRIDKHSKRHDTPDKAMKIDWPNHLQFNHLAGLGA
jgi:hypothetical protein